MAFCALPWSGPHKSFFHLSSAAVAPHLGYFRFTVMPLPHSPALESSLMASPLRVSHGFSPDIETKFNRLCTCSARFLPKLRNILGQAPRGTVRYMLQAHAQPCACFFLFLTLPPQRSKESPSDPLIFALSSDPRSLVLLSPAWKLPSLPFASCYAHKAELKGFFHPSIWCARQSPEWSYVRSLYLQPWWKDHAACFFLLDCWHFL